MKISTNLNLILVFLFFLIVPAKGNSTQCVNYAYLFNADLFDTKTQQPIDGATVMIFFDDREYTTPFSKEIKSKSPFLGYATASSFGSNCRELKSVNIVIMKEGYFTQRFDFKMKDLKIAVGQDEGQFYKKINLGRILLQPADKSFDAFMISQFGFGPSQLRAK